MICLWHPGCYDLGYHLETRKLYRLTRRDDHNIPEGFVRIVRHKRRPPVKEDGLLWAEYWSLPRDIELRLHYNGR